MRDQTSLSALFQLTTSRRGRLKICRIHGIIVTFQLTTSRRGRLGYIVWLLKNQNFNSLPHAEVDDFVFKRTCSGNYFNSLPHAEVDHLQEVFLYRLGHYFNSLPHAEVDGYSRSSYGSYSHFNSLPHAEVDQRLRFGTDHSKVFQLTTSRRGRR